MVRDLFWGIKWGLVFAVAFTLAACAMTLLTGGEIIERQGVSLSASIAIYFLGGITGGAVLGLLRPLTRRRIGAALVGVVVMCPVGLITGLFLAGPFHSWESHDWIGITLTSVLMGAVGGYWYWEPHDDL